MKKHFLIGLSLLAIIGCTSKKEQKTIVSGKILSGETSILIKNVNGSSLSMAGNSYEANTDENGNFSIEIPIEEYSSGFISVGNYYYGIKIKPLDKIEIVIDGDSIAYSGTGANKNTFAKSIKDKNLSPHVIYSELYQKKHSLESFSSMLNKFKFQRDSLLTAFMANSTLDSCFINEYNTETLVMYNYGLYRYPFIYLEQEGKSMDDIELADTYMEYRSIHDLAIDEYVDNSLYINILSGAVYNAAYAKNQKDPSVLLEDLKLKLILDIPGLSREYLLARHINDMAGFKATVDPVIIQSFNMLDPSEKTAAFVDSTVSKFNEKQSYIGSELPANVLETVLEDTAGNKLTLGDLIDQNEGSVLYVDMWSLGCGPCRMSMPYAKELSKELYGSNIKFIYITADSNKDNLWEEVFKVSLTQDNHYRFVNSNNTPLHKLFEISWVPNYMVFGRDGELVLYSAQSPVDYESHSVNLELKELLLDI